MKVRKNPIIFGFFLIFLLLATWLSAESVVGTIAYVEGTVDVSRNGRYLDWYDIDIGLEVEEFDLVETGRDGYVEIEMNAPASGGSLVKIREDSSFYFNSTEEFSGGTSTSFRMLRGSLSLKVGRLASREKFEVHTDTAVMGVRGTDFTVDMAPDRSVLISVPEGRVVTETPQGAVLAEPGTVATVDDDKGLSAVAIEPEDIELFRQYWWNLRLDALRINARLSTQFYAGQWQQMGPKFSAAMEELARHEVIFDRWARIMDGNAAAPSLSDAMKDRQVLSRGMVMLRGSMPYTERIFYTLTDLEKYHAQGYGRGSIGDPTYSTTESFYNSFNRQKEPIRQLFLTARWMIRVYRFLEMESGGGFPSGGMSGPDMFGSSPF